jgi:hypothetical protein
VEHCRSADPRYTRAMEETAPDLRALIAVGKKGLE